MTSHSENKGETGAPFGLCWKGGIGYAKYAGLLLGILLLVAAVACQGRDVVRLAAEFDGEKACAHVQAQVALGPRPVGSAALLQTAAYIESSLASVGWRPTRVMGEFRGVPIVNILAETSEPERATGGKILIGAHYDTRPVADRDPVAARRGEPILGANDGASGVAVLLELARVYDPARSKYDVVLAFFDGEDKGGIDGWPFSVGADIVAERLSQGLSAMILVDMVGDSDLQVFYEGNSDLVLARDIWATAARLGYGQWFVPEARYTLMDDHVPFLRRGVPAIDIIDFDYAYWHTVSDTADKVSPRSLEMVGRVLLGYLYAR